MKGKYRILSVIIICLCVSLIGCQRKVNSVTINQNDVVHLIKYGYKEGSAQEYTMENRIIDVDYIVKDAEELEKIQRAISNLEEFKGVMCFSAPAPYGILIEKNNNIMKEKYEVMPVGTLPDFIFENKNSTQLTLNDNDGELEELIMKYLK